MTKTDRVLDAFLTGRSFNRLEAEKLLHDHCLPSTVSALERRHQITIARKFETVCGYQGHPASVCRYWVYPKERERIKQKLKKDCQKKAATPTDQDKESGFRSNLADATASKTDSQIPPDQGE